MEILSSARSTCLSSFENLEEICSYESPENDSTDFKLLNGKNIFTQINKKNGLEFLQIISEPYSTNENFKINRLRKMKIDNLYCLTPLKSTEIALGMSNGEILLFDYKTNKYNSKFPAETTKHSVISLDTNSSDDYLASVYENGLITIYGMKTKNKLETLILDKNSTLARFHEKKRFNLAIASYKGSVFLYDVQAHKKIFQAVEKHSAPCRDIAMSANHPDCLYSAGYDSIINIYDIRKKATIDQIKCRYPLSTMAVSECGIYCCAGNLKGEILVYDLRIIKKPIAERKVHDSAVVRVAFLPPITTNGQSTFPAQISLDTITEINEPSNNEYKNFSNNFKEKKRDSFYEYIDFQNFQSSRRNSRINNTKNHRESFDWEQLGAIKRLQNDRRNNNENLMKTALIGENNSIDQCSKNSIVQTMDQLQNTSDVYDTKLKSPNLIEKVEVAKENVNSEKSNLNGIDVMNEIDIDSFLKINRNALSSTQNNVNLNSSQLKKTGASEENLNKENGNLLLEIHNQLKQIKLEMTDKFRTLENEMKFTAESNRILTYSQNYNFWSQQNKVNDDMSEALNFLLDSDDFYQEFCRLKVENEELKITIESLKRNSL